MQTKIIEDGGTSVDFWIIKVHTSNYLLYNTETKQDTDMIQCITPIQTLCTQYDPRLGDSNEDRVAGAPVSLAGVVSTKCIVKHIETYQYVL